MARPWLVPVVLAALILALGIAASGGLSNVGGGGAGTASLAGTVRADVVVVRAPTIEAPAPDVTIGLPSSGGSQQASTRRGSDTSKARTSGAPVVAGLLVSAEATQGARVETGQVLARLDTSLLDLGVEQAKASARRTAADIDVIDVNLDTLAGKTADLNSAKAQIDDALAMLRSQRARVAADLAAAKKLLASLPPAVPPPNVPGTGTPPIPPTGGNPPIDPRVLVAKLTQALAKIDAGIAKATAARAKLATGRAQIADARTQLRDARELLTLSSDAAEIGIVIAEAKRAQATVLSPVSGLVLEAKPAGTVAMADAPLVRIRPDGPVIVDTYLTAEQASRLPVGSRARMTSDSLPGRTFAGTVTDQAADYEYPPTTFATSEVHMMRAVRVEITIRAGSDLPPGTPVDVSIRER